MNILNVLFISAATQFSLPPGLLDSLCYVESKHDIKAIHFNDGGSNSVGICQIKRSTAKDLGFKGTEEDLMKPEINIYYAAAYLNHQIKRYGQIEKAVIAYNQGHAGKLTNTKYSKKVFKQWRSTQLCEN